MNKKLLSINKWSLIIIKDPKLLPGISILNVIKDLLIVQLFKFVVLDNIYGALISSIVEIEKDIIEINDLFRLLPGVKQFDWGDFFLFKEYPINWLNSKEQLYPSILIQTNSTIRAVDNEYIYIYTPSQEVVNFITSMSKYNIESIQIDFLDNLPYPE